MGKVFCIIKRNLKWLIIFICLIGFLALTEDVYNQEIMKGDIIGYQLVSHFINDNLTPFIKIITNFGNAIILISITILSLIFIKKKRIGLLISLNLIIISVTNILLKSILQRPRPTDFNIINESGYSFPSGHSMISMAFYGFIIYLIFKYVSNKYVKWILICILSLLILLIGLSRIYLGVHYTSDVLAGFFISIAYLFLFIGLTNKLIDY